MIGDIESPDHTHLPAGYRCFFWGEYTPFENTDGKKWNYSATNQLISNFKKKLNLKNTPAWDYKIQAINTAALSFSVFWKWSEIQSKHRLTLIPIPPSKKRSDPAYDSRILDMLHALAQQTKLPLDIRDCLEFSGKYAASHETTTRPTPDELFEELSFNAATGRPDNQPDLIMVFDDLLTTGAHFQAVVRKLKEHFPNATIIGNFIARRIVPNPFADFDDLSDVL